MGQLWPLFVYFRSFQTINTIFTTNQCERMSSPSSIRRWDLNPQHPLVIVPQTKAVCMNPWTEFSTPHFCLFQMILLFCNISKVINKLSYFFLFFCKKSESFARAIPKIYFYYVIVFLSICVSLFLFFFLMSHPLPFFHLFFVFWKKLFLQKINVKNVHPASGARIGTHNLLNMTLLE